jgi:hypothetical protein
VPGFHHAVAGAFAGNRQAMQLARQTHGEVADVDHLLHLAQPFGAHLAGLQRHQQAQGLLVLAQLLAQAAHQFAAHGGGHGAPLQEGGVRALDERLGLCAGVAGKLGVHGAVARCAHAQALALPGGQVQAQLLQDGVKKGAGGYGHGRPERCNEERGPGGGLQGMACMVIAFSARNNCFILQGC